MIDLKAVTVSNLNKRGLSSMIYHLKSKTGLKTTHKGKQ